MRKVLVIVDGLMSAGKTHLLSQIHATNASSVLIPEILPSLEPDEIANQEFYDKNDQMKLDLASRNAAKLVLMDRSFLSTFAYTMSHISYDFTDAEDQKFKKMVSEISCPALLIYLQIDPEKSLWRSKQLGKSVLGQWKTVDSLTRMTRAYEKLYAIATVKKSQVKAVRLSSEAYWAEPHLIISRVLNDVEKLRLATGHRR